jgi:hypothetical protein
VPPRRSRHGRTAESDGLRESPCQTFTDNIWRLSTPIAAQPPAPAEIDMQRYFKVSPPSVHQMVLTLEREGFITRQPRVARSIEILIEPRHAPSRQSGIVAPYPGLAWSWARTGTRAASSASRGFSPRLNPGSTLDREAFRARGNSCRGALGHRKRDGGDASRHPVGAGSRARIGVIMLGIAGPIYRSADPDRYDGRLSIAYACSQALANPLRRSWYYLVVAVASALVALFIFGGGIVQCCARKNSIIGSLL